MRAGPVVLLDANALFLPLTHGVDLVEEVGRWHPGARLVIPSSVDAELAQLDRRGVAHARVARSLAQGFPRWRVEGQGDDAIVRLADRTRSAVVTADRGLRDRLAALGLVVLVPRDRARLEPFRRRARRATVKRRPPLARHPRGGSTDARRR